MSPRRVLSDTEASRVKPMTFGRAATPAPARADATGSTAAARSTDSSQSTGSTQVAIHMEEEIERRTRELTERLRVEAQRAGFNHGVEAARAEIGPLLAALTEASRAVAGSTEAALDDLAKAAAQIGLAIAETVIGQELDTNPTAFIDSVRRTVHALEGDDDVVVHLHPADAAVLRELHEGDGDAFRIAEDHGLDRGACRVESAIRIAVDGVGRRLDHIRQAIGEIE